MPSPKICWGHSQAPVCPILDDVSLDSGSHDGPTLDSTKNKAKRLAAHVSHGFQPRENEGRPNQPPALTGGPDLRHALRSGHTGSHTPTWMVKDNSGASRLQSPRGDKRIGMCQYWPVVQDVTRWNTTSAHHDGGHGTPSSWKDGRAL